MQAGKWQGILMMLGATFTFALMDACMKQLTAHYPPLQVAFLRGLAALPFVIAWLIYKERRFDILLRVRWPLYILRGVLAIILLTSFIYALQRMALSEAYTLFFIAPLLITAFSAPLLGEKVSTGQWLAIVIGFSGVLVALQPDADMDVFGAIAAMIGATCYALNAITTRILGRTDPTAVLTFWFTAMLTVGAGMLCVSSWVTLQMEDTGWIIGVGVTGAIAQLLITSAFRRAPAALLAPLEYSALLWGVMLDVVLWQVLPSGIVFVGAGIIIASGLFLLKDERKPIPVSPP